LLLFILALLPFLGGCVSLQAFFHYPSLYTEYKRAGFHVRDDHREFHYDGLRNRSTLAIRETLVLVDFESDGAVDRVKAGPTEYSRGEPGTKELFRKYDRMWRDTTTYMCVGHFKEKWHSMEPSQITTRWSEARHEP